MRIFLIGFMGSGKSALGQTLASDLGLQFIDLDRQIEEKYGRDIPAIFEVEGEKHFRELERQQLSECLEKDDYVLATGGGTPCFYDNMERLNASGTTIYLKLSTDALCDRLSSETEGRPLLQGRRGQELWNYIHETLQEREPYYLQSRFKVKAKDLKPAELAEFVRLYQE